MPFIRWRPFGDIDRFFEDLYTRNGQDLAADVYEENDTVTVEMLVTGMKPDEIDISVEDNHLRIIGSRKEKEEVGDRGYYYKEIRRGDFERIIPLPTAVDSSKARADFSNGVLKIVLPKKKATQPNKIKIKVK